MTLQASSPPNSTTSKIDFQKFKHLLSGPFDGLYTYLRDQINKDNVNDQDPKTGRTPLHFIIRNHEGNHSLQLCTLLLVEKEANPNVYDNLGATPLHYALKEDDLRLPELLLKHCADINAQVKSATAPPLHEACKRRNTEVVRFLLDHDADVHKKDISGKGALHYLGYIKGVTLPNNPEEMINALLSKGCKTDGNPEQFQPPPLHMFVRSMFRHPENHAHTICQILAAKTDMSLRDQFGILLSQILIHEENRSQSHLTLDQIKACLEIIICCTENEIQNFIFNVVNARTSKKWGMYQRKYAAMFLMKELSKERKIPLPLLEEFAPEIQSIPDDGESIISAAGSGDLECVKCLLKAGADIESRNKSEATPLVAAVIRDQYNVVKFLLENKANPNTRHTDNSTVLMQACFKSSRQIITLLLEAGADPNTMADGGNTPLMVACSQANYDAIHALLRDTRIDVTLSNNEGKNALHCLLFDNSNPVCPKMVEVIRCLLEKGIPPNVMTAQVKHSAISQLGYKTIYNQWSHEEDLYNAAKLIIGSTRDINVANIKMNNIVDSIMERVEHPEKYQGLALIPIRFCVLVLNRADENQIRLILDSLTKPAKNTGRPHWNEKCRLTAAKQIVTMLCNYERVNRHLFNAFRKEIAIINKERLSAKKENQRPIHVCGRFFSDKPMNVSTLILPDRKVVAPARGPT